MKAPKVFYVRRANRQTTHSVRTKCEVYRIEEGEFVQPKLIGRAKFFAKRAGKRTKPSILCAQNARFRNACKSVLSDLKQQKGRLDYSELRHGVGLCNCVQRVPCRIQARLGAPEEPADLLVDDNGRPLLMHRNIRY